jgi:broad specificity phosphatase PhoE
MKPFPVVAAIALVCIGSSASASASAASSSASSFSCGAFSSQQVPQSSPVFRAMPLVAAQEHTVAITGNQKIVHFVRHAEGLHNEAAVFNKLAYLRDDLLDADITKKGRQQCQQLHDKTHRLVHKAELVCVSPLTRTMHTALLSFPELKLTIPWLAIEYLRERTGLHPCDKRRSLSYYKTLFPSISLQELDFEEDPWYDTFLLRESEENVMLRARKFLDWLSRRPEQEVVVVSHDGFLRVLFTKVLHIEGGSTQFQKFANCEMRSLVLTMSKSSGNSHKNLCTQDCP